MSKLARLARSLHVFAENLKRPPVLAPATAPWQRPRVGVALGGGFARGLAHLGVMKVLEDEQIPIDYVAGTSVGAVLGAMYASGVSVQEMLEVAHLVRFKDFARWTVSRFGFCSNDRMSIFLHKLVRVKTFEELRLPLAVAATDFVTGDAVVFRSGPLVDAIRASCAYPGMFLPVNINGRLLVDGLLAHPVPSAPLREMGADRVIGIHLSAHWVNLRGPRHVFDVIGQCFSIAQEKMSGVWRAASDVVLEPNVDGIPYDAFERAPEMILAGEAAARAALPQIRQWIAEPAVAVAPARPRTAPRVEPAVG
ncbi:MAG TPA: patatin-like phospholipase family protein [Terriglobales bacterium]|nr:patatin-like phospholipase family protein [Terriglobales bacterium]